MVVSGCRNRCLVLMRGMGIFGWSSELSSGWGYRCKVCW